MANEVVTPERLKAAFDRSLRKAEHVTGCRTVVAYVEIEGEEAQVQVTVTKNTSDW